MRAILHEILLHAYWLFFHPTALRLQLLERAPDCNPTASGLALLEASRSRPFITRHLVRSLAVFLMATPLAALSGSAGIFLIGVTDYRTFLLQGIIGFLYGAVAGIVLMTWVSLSGGVVFAITSSFAIGVLGGIGIGSVTRQAASPVRVLGEVLLGSNIAALVDVIEGLALGGVFGAAVGMTLGTTASQLDSLALPLAICACSATLVGLDGGFVAGGSAGIVSFAVVTLCLLRMPQWFAQQLWTLAVVAASKTGRLSPIRALKLSPHNSSDPIQIPILGLESILLNAGWSDKNLTLNSIRTALASPGIKATGQYAAATLFANTLTEPKDMESLVRFTDSSLLDEALLPDEINHIPSTLTLAAESIRASFLTHRGLRKLEMLHRALSTLEDAHNRLAFVDDYYAFAYQFAIDHWITIIEADADRILLHVEQQDEILSPFYAGLALGPRDVDRFVGREDDLRWLEDKLCDEGPSTLFLAGAGRVGKSSLLRCLPVLLGPSNLPVWIDCQGFAACETASGVYDLIMLSIARQVQESNITTGTTLVDTIGSHREPYVAFRRFLVSLRKVIGERRLLMCLDEIPEIDGLLKRCTIEETFLATLRNLAQEERWITLLFSGRRRLAEMPPYWAGYFNHVASLTLTCIDRRAAHVLLTRPTTNPDHFPITYEEAALSRILDVTAGQPFLVQAVGDALVRRLNDERRRELRVGDLEAVFAIVLEEHETVFRDWAHDYSQPAESAILCALATGDPQEEAALLTQAEAAAGDARAARSALRRLKQDDLLVEVDGGLAFRSELVRRYWEEEVA